VHPIRAIANFYENSFKISCNFVLSLFTGVNCTGDKLFTGVNDTGDKLSLVHQRLSLFSDFHQFQDTGDKFFARNNDAGNNL
jgi:hypothetical protein